MTKEAMIKVLRYKAEHIKTKIKPEFFAEVADTLEQEPCEDAVSKQVINELFNSEIKMYEERIETRKGANYHDETERIKEFRCRIANAEYWQYKIKDLPPVTPKAECSCNQIKWERDMAIAQLNELGYGLGEKPKTGHWINKKPRWIPSISMTIHDAYECSECGEPGIKYWRHCIHCGSPMELEEN